MRMTAISSAANAASLGSVQAGLEGLVRPGFPAALNAAGSVVEREGIPGQEIEPGRPPLSRPKRPELSAATQSHAHPSGRGAMRMP